MDKINLKFSDALPCFYSASRCYFSQILLEGSTTVIKFLEGEDGVGIAGLFAKCFQNFQGVAA